MIHNMYRERLPFEKKCRAKQAILATNVKFANEDPPPPHTHTHITFNCFTCNYFHWIYDLCEKVSYKHINLF